MITNFKHKSKKVNSKKFKLSLVQLNCIICITMALFLVLTLSNHFFTLNFS